MSILKKLSITLSIGLVALLIYIAYIWPEPRTEPFGSMPSDRYITLTGAKPSDAKVTAYVTFYGGGETCNSISFSTSNGKFSNGAQSTIKVMHNYSPNSNRYEVRIPYREYDEKCHMKLYDFDIELSNEFDNSFAKVRFVRSNQLDQPEDIYPVTTTFKADDCYANIQKWAVGERWSGQQICNYKNSLGRRNFNETSIIIDFDALTDSTVITYDIYAGDKYRSTPLDPTKSPE